jgi:cyclic pyranopterin phosphate synthase
MGQLIDKFGRVHDYLRISLVDKCNLRCTYCMPENARFMPEDQLLSANEIVDLAHLFVNDYGIKKIRFTGGEPLVRKEAASIIERITQLPVKLAITTNAILLDRYFDLFQQVGLNSMNVSLDSFNPEEFLALTKRDEFDKVKANIDRAIELGFRIKLNMVVMKGVNDKELIDFVARTEHDNLHVRFIEFMPFDGNSWNWDKVLSYSDMMQRIEAKFEVEKLKDGPNSTSKSYQVKGFKGTFAVISSVTAPFCTTCNRIRITADGMIRNCLFDTGEINLLKALRNNEDVHALIEQSIANKAQQLGGLPNFQDQEKLMENLSDRSMVKIGG